MQIPTVKVTKDGEVTVINECRLDNFLKRGYEVVVSEDEVQSADEKVETTDQLDAEEIAGDKIEPTSADKEKIDELIAEAEGEAAETPEVADDKSEIIPPDAEVASEVVE